MRETERGSHDFPVSTEPRADLDFRVLRSGPTPKPRVHRPLTKPPRHPKELSLLIVPYYL